MSSQFVSVCDTSIIGVSDKQKFPDHRFSASSVYNSHYATYKARFSSTGWTTTEAGKSNAWLRIDLGSAYTLCAIATMGYSGSIDERVKEYKVSYTMDNINWQVYMAGQQERVS